MKKALLLLVPTLLMITACDGNSFNVEFLDGVSHEPGFEGQSTETSNASVPYSYMSNSSYDVSALIKATMTFENIKTSDSDVINTETIKSYIKLDQQGFVYEIAENVKHFGTKNEGFAFLGNEYNDEYGQITFVTSVSVKNVIVKTQQYAYLKTAFNQNELIIDEDVAIAVNDSGFIKLDKAVLNEEKDQITNYTECAFSLGEGTSAITIKAGKRRAILKEISFYY